MVRRLPARVESGTANSPVQVGAQTCTRLLAFREIQRDLHFSKMEEHFSATGRRGRFAENPAKRDDFSALTSYFSDNNDLMAEHAVRCEPSSAEVPCQQGKLQGLGPEKPVLFRKEEKHRFDFVPVNPVETRTMGYGKQRIVSRTSGKRIPCYTPRFNGKGGA